jgi:uncharacterized repeat protein (TIGR03803 family)
VRVAMAAAAAIVVFIVQTPPLHAAKTTVIYPFGRHPNDGAFAIGSLLPTKSGALYITTNGGCSSGDGGVFKLVPSSRRWKMHDVYCFKGEPDGDAPMGGVVSDSKGNLYGTTAVGGEYAYGTVYQLTPDHGGWLESVIYSFKESEARNPVGDLIMDSGGALYGVVQAGGSGECGGVFRIEKVKGNWKEEVLAAFNGGNGCAPASGLHMDARGTLYGTTEFGGSNSAGVIFSLAGTGNLSILYDFSVADGANPEGRLVEDSSGALYGTTYAGGANGLGTVFAITRSGRLWTETLLHSFSGSEGANPDVGLTLDASGVLYGTTRLGGRSNEGVAFKLAGHGSSWRESVLHSFGKDGIVPRTPVTDDSGVLYGATQSGGKYGFGTVYATYLKH